MVVSCLFLSFSSAAFFCCKRLDARRRDAAIGRFVRDALQDDIRDLRALRERLRRGRRRGRGLRGRGAAARRSRGAGAGFGACAAPAGACANEGDAASATLNATTTIRAFITSPFKKSRSGRLYHGLSQSEIGRSEVRNGHQGWVTVIV